MFNFSEKLQNQELVLYNKILSLSRNKLFYTNFKLADSFQIRINLIFIHSSFLFNKIKTSKNNKVYKIFYQKMFDLIFDKIEINMREIGYGDTTVNKNMKILIKSFYNILLECETYDNKNTLQKNSFFQKYLNLDDEKKYPKNDDLVKYFDQYQSFVF